MLPQCLPPVRPAVQTQYSSRMMSRGLNFRLSHGGLATLRQNFSQPLLAVLAAVAIVLVISCANIAGLMLARSAARRKEMAMRIALGATGARIIRQLLTESLLLSVLGGSAGIVVGYLGAGALASFLSHNWFLPLQVDVHPDTHVLAFTVLASSWWVLLLVLRLHFRADGSIWFRLSKLLALLLLPRRGVG